MYKIDNKYKNRKSKTSKKKTIKNKNSKKTKILKKNRSVKIGGGPMNKYLNKKTNNFSLYKLVHATQDLNILFGVITTNKIYKQYDVSEDRYNGFYTSPIFHYNKILPLDQLCSHGDIIFVLNSTILNDNEYEAYTSEIGGGKMIPDARKFVDIIDDDTYGRNMMEKYKSGLKEYNRMQFDYPLVNGEVVLNKTLDSEQKSITENIIEHIDLIIVFDIKIDDQKILLEHITKSRFKNLKDKIIFLESPKSNKAIDLETHKITII